MWYQDLFHDTPLKSMTAFKHEIDTSDHQPSSQLLTGSVN
jgi:hypothetical protein